MKSLIIFLVIVFAHSPLQALSAKYGLYIYYVDHHARVDIYQASGDDHVGLSVAETVTFLKTVSQPTGMMIAVVAEGCERSDYTPILKTILDRGADMYLSGFNGSGGDQMRTWIVRHRTELTEHGTSTGR